MHHVKEKMKTLSRQMTRKHMQKERARARSGQQLCVSCRCRREKPRISKPQPSQTLTSGLTKPNLWPEDQSRASTQTKPMIKVQPKAQNYDFSGDFSIFRFLLVSILLSLSVTLQTRHISVQSPAWSSNCLATACDPVICAPPHACC